jgi:hypothetical protein
MSRPDAEHEAMTAAAEALDLDPAGARLGSTSSRLGISLYRPSR